MKNDNSLIFREENAHTCQNFQTEIVPIVEIEDL